MEIIFTIAEKLFSIFGPAVFYGVLLYMLVEAIRMHLPKKKKPQNRGFNIGDEVEF